MCKLQIHFYVINSNYMYSTCMYTIITSNYMYMYVHVHNYNCSNGMVIKIILTLKCKTQNLTQDLQQSSHVIF